MGKKCSVSNCQKNGENTALFSFPKDGLLSEKWLDANPMGWTTVKTKYVCKDHFHESDIIGNAKIPRIKQKAVPCIFHHRPAVNEVKRYIS